MRRVFELVTNYYLYASLALNRSARWDQYSKTALQLAETSKHQGCIYILKQVQELSIGQAHAQLHRGKYMRALVNLSISSGPNGLVDLLLKYATF